MTSISGGSYVTQLWLCKTKIILSRNFDYTIIIKLMKIIKECHCCKISLQSFFSSLKLLLKDFLNSMQSLQINIAWLIYFFINRCQDASNWSWVSCSGIGCSCTNGRGLTKAFECFNCYGLFIISNRWIILTRGKARRLWGEGSWEEGMA